MELMVQDRRPPSLNDNRAAPAPITCPSDDAGAVSGVSVAPSASADGAARRAAELEAAVASLQAEVERTRRLLDAATDHAVITMNLDGRVTGWNAGARAILGYGEAEMLGRSGEMRYGDAVSTRLTH